MSLGYVAYFFAGGVIGSIIDNLLLADPGSYVPFFSPLLAILGLITYNLQQKKSDEWMAGWLIFVFVATALLIGALFLFGGYYSNGGSDIPKAKNIVVNETNNTVVKLGEIQLQQPVGWRKVSTQEFNKRLQERLGSSAQTLALYQNPENKKQLIVIYAYHSQKTYPEFFDQENLKKELNSSTGQGRNLLSREVISKRSQKWMQYKLETAQGYKVLMQFTIADKKTYTIRYVSPKSIYNDSLGEALDVMNRSYVVSANSSKR